MMLNKIFGAKKKTELEKNQEELQIVNGGINEEQAKQQRLKEGLRLIEIEFEVDSSDKELAKRKKRLEVALEGSVQRMTDLQARKGELEKAIAQLNFEKEQARLEELAEQDAKNFESIYRAGKLKSELEKIATTIHHRTVLAGAGSPRNLLRDAGVKLGHFDRENPAHQPYLKLWNEKTSEVRERVDSEIEELIEKLKGFLGE